MLELAFYFATLAPLLLGGGRVELPPEPRPVAQVLWLTGPATIPRPTQPFARPLSVGDTLEAYELIEVPADTHLWILYKERELVHLTGRAYATLEPERGIQAVTGPVPEHEQLPGYTHGNRAPIGAQEAPAEAADLGIVHPRATAVLGDSPELRWVASGAPQDARFDLTLWRRRADGTLALVEQWRGLVGTTHTLFKPLSRGERYRWTVSLSTPLGFPPEAGRDTAWFEVLAATELPEVERSLAAIEARIRRSESPRPELHVLRALCLESHGLLDAARREWQLLIEDGAEDPGPGVIGAARYAARIDARTRLPPLVRPRLPLAFGFELTLPWSAE